MNKKNIIIISCVAVIAIIAMIVFNRLTHKKNLSLLFSEARITDFEIIVSTTGELQAENSLDIKGPEGLQSRNIRFGGIKIQDLIPEGTVVREGDYIATLDRSDADNSFKEELDNQEKYETAMTKAIIDTTIALGDLRDEMLNLKFAVEEAQITLDESKYEPPTTIRQAQISLDKAKRSYLQAVTNYDLKVKQAIGDVREAEITLDKQRRKVNDMRTVIEKFTITAPAPGMVIYKREWDGSKRQVGSQISAWDPVVATLPDLSSMISKTYVNEIDISKVKVGQKVRITVDAFPEKSYTGIVSSVANIGEQLPNTDAKVFEVITKVDGTDPILRPSMTTGNQIITKTFKKVLNIPLECVFATSDSIPFVYTRNGYRQVVVLGESNENNIIVEQGLKDREQIYLSVPEGGEKFRLTGDELVAVIKDRVKAKKAEEARERAEAERMKAMNEMEMPPFGDPEKMKEFVKNMTPEQREQIKKMHGEGRMPGKERPASEKSGAVKSEVKVVQK